MTDSKMEEKVTALEETKQNQPSSPGTEIVSLLGRFTHEQRLVKTNLCVKSFN